MPRHTPLTDDEVETLRRLAATLKLPEIAAQLGRTLGVVIAGAFRAGVPLEPKARFAAFQSKELAMATNKPKDGARKGAVKKRTQLATKTQGKKTFTKRSKESGQFLDQKKAPAKKKFKGVRMER